MVDCGQNAVDVHDLLRKQQQESRGCVSRYNQCMQADAIASAVEGQCNSRHLQSMTSPLTSVLSGAAGSPAALTVRGARLLPMGAGLPTDLTPFDAVKVRATGTVVFIIAVAKLMFALF